MDIVAVDRAYSLSQLQQMAWDAGVSKAGTKKEVIRRLLDAGVDFAELRFLNAYRELSDEDIRRASQIIFDTVQVQTATVFGAKGQPLVTYYADLSPSQQEQAFQGLKDRIQRETLRGYIKRKRATWGDRATDAVIRALQYHRLL